MTIPYVLKNFLPTVFERKFTYPYKIEKIKYKTREKMQNFTFSVTVKRHPDPV